MPGAALTRFLRRAAHGGPGAQRRIPDALTGGAPIGEAGGPVLLTQPDELHPDTEAYVCDNATRMAGRAYVFGGTGAISVEVEETARERLSRRRC